MTFQHPENQPNTPPAGWYPDPVTGVGLRWWDGVAWTDQTNIGIPPAPPGDAGGLSSAGAWMGATFRLVMKRAGHLFPLVVLLSVIPGIAVAIALYAALKDLALVVLPSFQSTEVDSIDIEGFDAGRMVPVGIAVVISVIGALLLSTAATLQFAKAAASEPERWDQSLRRALGRSPRVLGISLLTGLIFLGGLLVFVLLAVAVATIFAPLLLLLLPVGFVFLVWLGLRLTFATTAAALAPRGVGSIRQSFRLTSGRLWWLLGRLCLLLLCFVGLQFAGSLATAPFSAFVGPSPADLEGSRVELIDLMGGSLPLFAFGQLVSLLVGGCVTALSSAGLVLLYRGSGGEIESS